MEQLRNALYQTYMDYYVQGFKNNDVTLIDKIVRYPLAYIKDGSVTFVMNIL